MPGGPDRAAPATPSPGHAPPVRLATRAEVGALSRMLARAFHQDPVHRWMFREEHEWARGSHRVFAALMRVLVRRGSAYTTGGLEGAALWDEPGGHPPLTTQAVLAAVSLWSVGWSHSLTVARGLGQLERHRPEVPHWYLGILGTDPDHRGRGIGAALLGPVLARCDREALPAYLESSRPENVPFYERHGFEVTEEFRLGEGPPVWGMLRAPR